MPECLFLGENSRSRTSAYGRFLPFVKGSFGSIAALGLGVRITNWLEHYAPAYQFYGQGITNVEPHAFEDIVGEVNDDISRTITWVLAFYGCPHGFTHKGRLFLGCWGSLHPTPTCPP